MKTIYLDNDYRCHVEDGEGRRAIETEELDNKTEEEIPRFRFVPDGESWTRGDGELFRGIMLAPVGDNISEREDMRAALRLLGVTDDA